MKYRVLDDIMFHEAIFEGDRKVSAPRTATSGDVVEIPPKDAMALLKRGAIVPHTDDEPK